MCFLRRIPRVFTSLSSQSPWRVNWLSHQFFFCGVIIDSLTIPHNIHLTYGFSLDWGLNSRMSSLGEGRQKRRDSCLFDWLYHQTAWTSPRGDIAQIFLSLHFTQWNWKAFRLESQCETQRHICSHSLHTCSRAMLQSFLHVHHSEGQSRVTHMYISMDLWLIAALMLRGADWEWDGEPT